MNITQCKHGLQTDMCAFCSPLVEDFTFSFHRFVQKNLELDEKRLARKAVENMIPDQQKKLLVTLLEFHFGQIRRAGARRIEIAATPGELERREEQKETRARQNEDRKRRKELARERPWEWGAFHDDEWKDWVNRGPVLRKVRLEKEAPAYAEWLGKRHPDYLGEPMTFNGYRVEKAFEDFRKATKQEVLLELTEELLGTSFSLPDGRRIMWGEATIEDHQRRIEFLLAQAGGTVATAKRHESAIKMLVDNGAATLNQIALAAA